MGDRHPTRRQFCHYCTKEDYRWTYDIVDKIQVKRWISEYDPNFADCEIDDELGDTKIPRMLVRTDSRWIDVPNDPGETPAPAEAKGAEQNGGKAEVHE
jgi:hypothetical protein